MEETFYAVSLVFNKRLQNGSIDTHNSVRCLWAKNEHEAFGLAFDSKPESIKDYDLSIKVVVPTTFTRQLEDAN